MDFSGINRTERESRTRHNERIEKIHMAMQSMTKDRKAELEELAMRLEIDEGYSACETSGKLLNWVEAMKDVDALADSDMGRVSMGAALKIEELAREEYLNCLQEE